MNNIEKKLALFKEEFVDYKDEYEIYKNPTSSEMVTLLKNARASGSGNMLRYILDMNGKNIYLFPSELLHAWATKKLKIPYVRSSQEYNGYLFGQGVWEPQNRILMASYTVIHPNREYNKKAPSAKKIMKHFGKYLFFVNTGEEFNEAFEAYAGKGEDTAIFKNPTAKEMREFDQYVRFLIRNRNGKKDVYVFHDGLLHAKAAEELGVNYLFDNNILAGVALKRGKDWIMIDSYNLKRKLIKGRTTDYFEMLGKDWTNPYIKVEDYMTKQVRSKKR